MDSSDFHIKPEVFMTKKRDANEFIGAVFPLEHPGFVLEDCNARVFLEHTSFKVFQAEGSSDVLCKPEDRYKFFYELNEETGGRNAVLDEIRSLKQLAETIINDEIKENPNALTPRMTGCKEACFILDATTIEIQKIDCRWFDVVRYLLRAQRLVMNETYRPLERPAVIGRGSKNRGDNLVAMNLERAFKIDRDELLKRCKDAFAVYGCNQKILAEHVATGLPIKKDRVLKLMQDYKIRKADYS